MTVSRRRSPTGLAVRLGAGLLASLLFVLFFIGNTQSVNIHFLVTTARAPLIWALLLSAGLGLLVGLLLPYIVRTL
ncbi:MAG: lipopolysaccharide assembly protein LapA domain-containing protein, partial [Dehalococcoidia bacterium]